MAEIDKTETDSFTWEVVPRQGRMNTSDTFISLRRGSIKMSKKMYELVDVKRQNYSHVIIRRDNAKMALLFQFVTRHFINSLDVNHPFHEALYELQPDGGKRPNAHDERNYSLINCGNILSKTPWLLSIVNDADFRSRRFEPTAQRAKGQFIVQFVPGFSESSSLDGLKINSDAKGIYCLLSANQEVLYIGRGCITKRLASHLKVHDMAVHTVKYTLIADDKTRRMAEAHHLAEYRNKYGLLPAHNTILSTAGEGG